MFQKWKAVDFILSLKDPSGWVKHGGSGWRGYWKTILRSTNDRIDKYSNPPNKSLVPLTLLIIATWFDLFFFLKLSVVKFEIFCFVIASSNLCGLFWHSSINLSRILPPSFTDVNKYISLSISSYLPLLILNSASTLVDMSKGFNVSFINFLTLWTSSLSFAILGALSYFVPSIDLSKSTISKTLFTISILIELVVIHLLTVLEISA